MGQGEEGRQVWWGGAEERGKWQNGRQGGKGSGRGSVQAKEAGCGVCAGVWCVCVAGRVGERGVAGKQNAWGKGGRVGSGVVAGGGGGGGGGKVQEEGGGRVVVVCYGGGRQVWCVCGSSIGVPHPQSQNQPTQSLSHSTLIRRRRRLRCQRKPYALVATPPQTRCATHAMSAHVRLRRAPSVRAPRSSCALGRQGYYALPLPP